MSKFSGCRRLRSGVPVRSIIPQQQRGENRTLDVFLGFFPTTLDGDRRFPLPDGLVRNY
jgi:hypothetical protein